MERVRTLKITVLGMVLVMAGASKGIAGTIYVNDDASGDNNGTSWTDAYTDLQSALTAAISGDTIWVASGTYKPTSGMSRSSSFSMKNGVAIYGGFAGYEDPCSFDLASRDFDINETILSGDIGTQDVNTDNCYQVVRNISADANAILEGFTITGGNANGAYPDNSGGGMRNSNQSSPTIINCTFSGNSASYGGGMSNLQSSPTVTNCTFILNSAINSGGGMINYNQSSPTIINCTFSGNSASYGGGMYNDFYSSPTVTNCILWNDTPDDIYNIVSTPTVTYSDVKGGYSGTGNINADPCFIDANAGDLRLKPNSPCIDAGNNAAVPSSITTDLSGLPRFIDSCRADTGSGTPPIVDMGAYEAQPPWTTHQNLLVNPGFETGNATGWITNWGWNLTATTQQVHSGSYSGLASARTASWQGAWQSVLGLMDDGKTYRISGWVRLQNAGSDYVALIVTQTDSAGSQYYGIDNATAYNDRWTLLDGTLALDVNGQLTGLYIYFEGPAPDVNFYVDDASVTEVMGDISHNGGVDFFDFSLFASYYEFDCATQDCAHANLYDCDNTVNELDLAIFVADWLVGVE